MSKPTYVCRRCGTGRTATWKETDPRFFDRVVCYACGGTCDPTPEELRRIDACRIRKRVQVERMISNSFHMKGE